LDLTDGFHKIIGNFLLDGNQDIGCFEVAYPHQSTSETNIKGCSLGNKSRIALFYQFGKYRQVRKISLAGFGKVRSFLIK
jgi:hypothetical protein